MASMSQYTIDRGCQAGRQTSYSTAVPPRKAVGSGANTKLPQQDNQSKSPDSTHTIQSSSLLLSQPTNAAKGSSALPIPDQPVSLPPLAPSTTLTSKPSPGPQNVSVPSHRRNLTLLLLVILASVCFGVTAWFAQATFSSKTFTSARDFFKSQFQVDIGDTLTILAVLSRLLTLLTALILDSVLDVLQWALICRDQGVSMSSVLAISGTTGPLGTLGILIGKGPEPVARIWAAAKWDLL
jgi:hypothetical protein